MDNLKCCATCKYFLKDRNPIWIKRWGNVDKTYVCKAQVHTDWSDGNFYFFRVKHNNCCELYAQNHEGTSQ